MVSEHGYTSALIFCKFYIHKKKKKIAVHDLNFPDFFRSLGLTFFIVLEAINHISICFNVLCDYMGHQMYVLFLDGGPLMVVQSYEEDDLKKIKKK